MAFRIDPTKTTYNRATYEANREKILAARKARYHSDEAHREHKKRRRRLGNTKMPPPPKQCSYSRKRLAILLKIQAAVLRRWTIEKSIPRGYPAGRTEYFTHHQFMLIREAVAFIRLNGTWNSEQGRALSARIFADWQPVVLPPQP